MSQERQIPKVIHYCWFGGNPLPEMAVKCIESWKKFCPEYEIVRWDESNYDVNACAYTKEAYQAKKWAFVSDFARFDILYRQGGLYFDTDVELIAPIDDIVDRGPFLGIEQSDNNSMVAPGLGMAATAGMEFYEKVLTAYRGWHFRYPDGSYNQTTVVKYTTELLQEYTPVATDQLQYMAGIWIYPWDYFCPMKYETGVITITDHTRAIHHFSATWLTKEERACHRFTAKASKIFGVKAGKIMGWFYCLPYRAKRKIRKIRF